MVKHLNLQTDWNLQVVYSISIKGAWLFCSLHIKLYSFEETYVKTRAQIYGVPFYFLFLISQIHFRISIIHFRISKIEYWISI